MVAVVVWALTRAPKREASVPPAPSTAAVTAQQTDRTPPPTSSVATRPVGTTKPSVAQGYAGSASCKVCHDETYEAWSHSHHALAERPIDPARDRAAFVPTQMAKFGSVTSTVRERDGTFEIVTLGGDGTVAPFAPTRILGHEPLRQYLIPIGNGRLQAAALAFDPAKGDWFDVFGHEDRKPHEWGFWANRGMNWNSQCASCHNTGLRKRYDPVRDAYDTRWAEMGVGCEACHGPTKAHVEWRTAHPGETDDPVPPYMPRERLVDVCGACHARRAELTAGYRVGDPFLDHFRPALPDHTDVYYPDGQVHGEAYEYTSFILSRMHLKGVRCSDCHVKGATRLAAEGNALCLRCHAIDPDPAKRQPQQLDPAAHSHHDVAGPGGQCVNCHMPVTVYMQRDPRRDHGLTIPDPLLTRDHGIPNACNRCHTDKSVAWAIEATDQWYGERMNRRTRRRAQLLARARAEDETVVPELIRLAGTEEIPAWRAVIARMLARWSHRPDVVQPLVGMCSDPSALVRAEAAGALEMVADMVEPALVPLLEDDRRAVRIQAAWALRRRLPLDTRAGLELLAYFAVNADQPTGAAMRGTFHRDRGEFPQAVAQFRRAIAFEPAGVPQRHALAVALSALADQATQAGDVPAADRFRTEAIEHLTAACDLAPSDAVMAQSLGLAYAEAGDRDKSIAWLEQACAIDPAFGRARYNLAMAYRDAGRPEDALKALDRAAAAEPDQPAYPFAAATILDAIGRPEQAQAAARRALAIDPGHQPATRWLAERGLGPQ